MAAQPQTPRRLGRAAALFALCAPCFLAIALLVYRPALDGDFVSDDWEVVAGNLYVHELSPDNLAEIIDPRAAPAFLSMNYAPVHLVAHGLAWRAFGAEPSGHHVVNVVLHAIVSALLAALLVESGASRPVAAIAGLVFLVHPANVEAVAWISQLKTLLAAAFSLGALLLVPYFPLVATLAFAAALLSKATALFALPAAAAFAFARRDRRIVPWLSTWTLLAVAYAVVELPIFRATGEVDPGGLDFAERIRQGFALAFRYGLMAATGIGVSAFQEPPSPRSWLDLRWLGGCVAIFLLGLRALRQLGRRSPEAGWWIWALAAFLPVAQVFSFAQPFADRYLYFILPGLLGAAALALASMESSRRRAFRPLAASLGLAACAVFGLWSQQRAHLWADEGALRREAAANYPQGTDAALLRAQEAIARGDADGAIHALERARDLGRTGFLYVVNDPRLAPLHRDPRFQVIVDELADRTIRRLSLHEPPNQFQQRTLALAHVVRREYAEAEVAFERARRIRGPLDELVEQEQAELRRIMGTAPDSLAHEMEGSI